MMAMQNSRISYFGMNIARLKKAIHTHSESDPLCRGMMCNSCWTYSRFDYTIGRVCKYVINARRITTWFEVSRNRNKWCVS